MEASTSVQSTFFCQLALDLLQVSESSLSLPSIDFIRCYIKQIRRGWPWNAEFRPEIFRRRYQSRVSFSLVGTPPHLPRALRNLPAWFIWHPISPVNSHAFWWHAHGACFVHVCFLFLDHEYIHMLSSPLLSLYLYTDGFSYGACMHLRIMTCFFKAKGYLCLFLGPSWTMEAELNSWLST